MLSSAMETEPHLPDIDSRMVHDIPEQISSCADSVRGGEAQEDAESCVICLETLTAPCEAEPCGHSHFDFLCLAAWLELRASCPLCQSNVRQVRYDLSRDSGQPKIYKAPEPPSPRRRSRSGSRSRSQSRSRSTRPEFEEANIAAVRRRRSIYQRNLYALHTGSNRKQSGASRHTELSPQLFMVDAALVSRARVWLRRELRVFQFLYADVVDPMDVDLGRPWRPSKAEYLREYIIAILKSVDLQDHSGQAEEFVRGFLGRDHARHLLHELKAWLRSPCGSLEEWDRTVQYSADALPRHVPDTEEDEAGLDPCRVQRLPERARNTRPHRGYRTRTTTAPLTHRATKQ